MLFTNSSGNTQPYVSWKGPTTKATVCGFSRPATNNNPDADIKSVNDAPNGSSHTKSIGSLRAGFKPRPIKHWRKSLMPKEVDGISRAAYSIQSDMPGSNVPLGTDVKCCENDAVNQVVYQYKQNEVPCTSNCNPQSNIIRSGMTEKLINPQSDGPAKKKYSFSTKEYLKSKCRTYNQNKSGTLIPDVEYSTLTNNKCCAVPLPYNDEHQGPQTRSALNCPTGCTIIVKPNNQQYFQQGAVDSSSRIARLKYNTVESNANSFATANGAAAASAGRYRADGNAPYFIKSKQQNCNKSLFHRQGNRTMCFTSVNN